MPPKLQQKQMPAGKAPAKPANPQPVPEHEIKQSSATQARMALQAGKKAYELRQAAHGMADAQAREDVLAKAINKEIEAEAFGKAAKYTRSGAFQGLAAGAGYGIQPGVTIGKLTGALVGGVLSSVGAILGAGVGSAYGAISGPIWDIGKMASQGGLSVIQDFVPLPDWKANQAQKKAFERMVMETKKTVAPNNQELEEMAGDNGGATEEDYIQMAKQFQSYIPSMPKMPKMPDMPQVPGFAALAGRQQQTGPSSSQQQQPQQPQPAAQIQQQAKPQAQGQPFQGPPKPKEPAKPKEAAPVQSHSSGVTQQEPVHSNSSSVATVKKKPKKLEVRSGGRQETKTNEPVKKAAAKLESRKPTTASA